MNEGNAFSEVLDDYHYGKISEEQLFKIIGQNPNYQEEYKRYLVEKDLAKLVATDHVNQWSEKALASYKKQRVIKTIFIGIGVLLGIYIVSQFFESNLTSPTSKTNQSLYANHYKKPDWSANRTSVEYEEDWTQIIKYYQDNQYDQVIAQYNANPIDSITNAPPQLLLIIGLSFAQEDQMDQAISILDLISKDSPIWIDATWYKALINIQLNRDKEAKLLLNKVIDYPGQYKENECRSILETLEAKSK